MRNYCPQCGSKLQYTESEVCPYCGIRTSTSVNNTRYILLVCLIFVGIIISLLTLFFLFSTHSYDCNFCNQSKIVANDWEPLGISSPRDWIWERDGWGGWNYSSSWTHPKYELNSEYGPLVIEDHGEYGTNVNLNSGMTESTIWKTFFDTTGIGWNTVTFDGSLSYSDIPSGRWIKIEAIGENGKGEIKKTADQNPPGNGDSFSISCTFPKSKAVTLKISHGQDPACCPKFIMKYYSVMLSTR